MPTCGLSRSRCTLKLGRLWYNNYDKLKKISILQNNDIECQQMFLIKYLFEYLHYGYIVG